MSRTCYIRLLVLFVTWGGGDSNCILKYWYSTCVLMLGKYAPSTNKDLKKKNHAIILENYLKKRSLIFLHCNYLWTTVSLNGSTCILFVCLFSLPSSFAWYFILSTLDILCFILITYNGSLEVVSSQSDHQALVAWRPQYWSGCCQRFLINRWESIR